MLFVNRVSRKERQLLVSYHKQRPNALVRARAQAIMMSYRGEQVPDIAETVFYGKRAVREWLNEWNERHLSSIFPAYDGNENAAKLTETQKQEVKTVLGSPPDDGGLPSTFWTVPKLKQYVSTTFGVIYESPQSYYYLLQHCGFSFKRPSPFDRRRDDALVAKRMKEIRREVKPFFEDSNWEGP
jgi:transposase